MKKIFSHLSNKQKSYLAFMALIAIPTIIICIVLFIIMSLNFSSSLNTLQDTVVSSLARIARTSEMKTASIVNATQLFGGNPILRRSLEDQDCVFDSSVSSELSILKNT